MGPELTPWSIGTMTLLLVFRSIIRSILICLPSMCNSFSHDIESQNHPRIITSWAICSRLNNNKEATLHTFDFHASRPCLALLLNQREHRDKGEEIYIKTSVCSAGSVVRLSKKSRGPRAAAAFKTHSELLWDQHLRTAPSFAMATK